MVSLSISPDLRSLTMSCEPGVMPFVSVEGLRRMAAMNRTTIPAPIEERLDALAGDSGAVEALGVEVAVGLCRDLMTAGAPGLHLYTLNRSSSVLRVWDALADGG